jgi:hypothetical protein
VAKATIDRDQLRALQALRALRALRRAFGPDPVTVLNVLEEPPGSRGPDRALKR